ncbi:unnamed protein product [Camellia sinensis]
MLRFAWTDEALLKSSHFCSATARIGSHSNYQRHHRPARLVKMASYLWRKYADYVYSKWEKTILWDMVDPYRRPKSFTPLVTIYILAFYTGVIGSAITEQLYKCLRVNLRLTLSDCYKTAWGTLQEKYWEDHPGHVVPLMKPKFYYGPWKILKGEALPPDQ